MEIINGSDDTWYDMSMIQYKRVWVGHGARHTRGQDMNLESTAK